MAKAFNLTTARWCFELFGEKWKLREHCMLTKDLGCYGLDLAPTKDWETIFDNGLKVTCALPDMGDGIPPFGPGFCNPDSTVRQHVRTAIKNAIDAASDYQVPFVIVFTGMAVDGVDKQQALANCIARDGFPDIVRYADNKDVGVVIEALNDVDTSTAMHGHPGIYGTTFDDIAQIVNNVNAAASGSVSTRRFGFVLDPYHQYLMSEVLYHIVEQHHNEIDVLHLAGVAANPPSHQNRCEIDLPGQQIDYGLIADQLAKKGKESMPVMCEWIPQLTDAQAGIKQAAGIFSA